MKYLASCDGKRFVFRMLTNVGNETKTEKGASRLENRSYVPGVVKQVGRSVRSGWTFFPQENHGSPSRAVTPSSSCGRGLDGNPGVLMTKAALHVSSKDQPTFMFTSECL